MLTPATPSTTRPAQAIVNPLIEQRADPWVYLHDDGYYYYFIATVPAYDRIELRRAKTLAGLATANPRTLWTRHEQGPMSWHIWAPEIHYIDGQWIIYFAAGRAEAVWEIRMYALTSDADNPLQGQWHEAGQIDTGWESFSLDATSFTHDGQRYLVWAQHDPAIGGNTNLYIAEMDGPTAIRGEPVMIAKPEHDWETIGHRVNEGPAVLIRNGRVFMTYSASATDANYCMGLLTADADADLLDPASWEKSPEPVFKSDPEADVYGPGHNSFTTSRDGTIDYLVYHGRDYEEIVGDPLRDPNRHTRVQVLEWNEDGTPRFGTPAPNGPLPAE